jgi:hypothetical protein
MPTPSLILVPARFKTGKLYTPVATTSGGLVLGASGDFNVTRATTATRVNASGLIESVASGIPRLDYPLGGGCPALLVEASGSNAFIQSQTLFTSHLVQNLTTSGYANVAISPDGTQNAEKFVPNTTNGVHGIADITSQTITSGTTYTFSCFAKSDGGANFPLIVLQLDSSTAWGATRNAIFNVVSGTIHGSAPSGVTMRTENYGSGWYRFSATATAIGSVSGTFQYRIYVPNSSATLSYAAASGNTEGVLVWGAQLEVGSIATSYIPTTTAAVTRNADVISVSGAVSGCIGQTQGTLYAEFRYLGPPTLRAGFITLRNASFRGFSINAPSNLGIRFESRNNAGTSTVVLTNTLNIGDYYKIAIAYDTGGTAAGGTQASGVTAYVNGSPATVSVGDLRVPDTALNEVRLYGAVTSTETETPNGNLRSAAFYTTKLTNEELAALTTL